MAKRINEGSVRSDSPKRLRKENHDVDTANLTGPGPASFPPQVISRKAGEPTIGATTGLASENADRFAIDVESAVCVPEIRTWSRTPHQQSTPPELLSCISLADLPDDILATVFAHLPASRLRNIATTCQRWNARSEALRAYASIEYKIWQITRDNKSTDKVLRLGSCWQLIDSLPALPDADGGHAARCALAMRLLDTLIRISGYEKNALDGENHANLREQYHDMQEMTNQTMLRHRWFDNAAVFVCWIHLALTSNRQMPWPATELALLSPHAHAATVAELAWNVVRNDQPCLKQTPLPCELQRAGLPQEQWNGFLLDALINTMPKYISLHKVVIRLGVLDQLIEMPAQPPSFHDRVARLLHKLIHHGGASWSHEPDADMRSFVAHVVKKAAAIPGPMRGELYYHIWVRWLIQSGHLPQDEVYVFLVQAVHDAELSAEQRAGILHDCVGKAAASPGSLPCFEKLCEDLSPSQRYLIWNEVSRDDLYQCGDNQQRRAQFDALLAIFSKLPPDLHARLMRVAGECISKHDAFIHESKYLTDLEPLYRNLAAFPPEHLQVALCGMARAIAYLPYDERHYGSKLLEMVETLPPGLRDKPMIAIAQAIRIRLQDMPTNVHFQMFAAMMPALPQSARENVAAALQECEDIYLEHADLLGMRRLRQATAPR